MTPFAAPPAEEGPLQQLGVEPIGLRPAMLTRHGDTGCVDHMGFDTARPQPPPQPHPVATGLKGDRDPVDRAPGPLRLGPAVSLQPTGLSRGDAAAQAAPSPPLPVFSAAAG
jgi:hypothetical protein